MQRLAPRLKVASQCGAVLLFQEDLFGGALVSDLDYTLNEHLVCVESVDTCQDDSFLSNILTLGGAVKNIVSLDTGEILSSVDQVGNAGARGVVGSLQGGTTCAGRVPLSTTHKSPFVEWASGAGLLKVSKGEVLEKKGGGKRGAIKGFSYASRLRMMRTIAKIKLDAELPDFVTLTYPDKFPTPKESKRHLDLYIKRLLRFFPEIGLIWKLEPQERGAPHYHMMAWGVSTHDLFMFTVKNWYEIAGNGDKKHLAFHMGGFGNRPCVEKVYNRNGVMSYASKYLGKTFEVAGWDEKWTGRYWAIVQKDNIPFGEDMVMYITHEDANIWMRYQRSFAKIPIYKKVWDVDHKKKIYLYENGKRVVLKKKKLQVCSPSLTIFSTADNWVLNIIRTKDNG